MCAVLEVGFRAADPSAVEAPAGRAVWLRRGDAEAGVEGEAVELPGRRPGTRGAERRREGLALHLRRPATLTIPARRLLQCRLIDHSGRLALKNKVDALQPDRDRTGRVGRQVARLAGLWTAGEIQV